MLDIRELEKEFAVLKDAELAGIRPSHNLRRKSSSNSLLALHSHELTPRAWDIFEETKSTITLIVDRMKTTSESQR